MSDELADLKKEIEKLESERTFLLARIKAEKQYGAPGPRWFNKPADALIFYAFCDEELTPPDWASSVYEFDAVVACFDRLPKHLQEKAAEKYEEMREVMLSKEENYDRNRILNTSRY